MLVVYLPDSQMVHPAVDSALPTNWPAAQMSHEADVGLDWNVPAAHTMHDAAATAEYLPAGQLVQPTSDAPVSAEK